MIKEKMDKGEVRLVPHPPFINTAFLIKKGIKMSKEKDKKDVYRFSNIYVACDEYKGEDYYLLIKDGIFQKFVIEEKQEKTFIGYKNFSCLGNFQMLIIPVEKFKGKFIPMNNIKVISEEYIHIKYEDGGEEYYLGKRYRVEEME